MKFTSGTREHLRTLSDEELGDTALRVDRARTRALDRGMTQSAQGAADVQDAVGDEFARRAARDGR